MPLKDDLIALVKNKATSVGIDPALACAVVEQESGWNPWAIRYEPAFFQKYIVPLLGLTSTEKVARSFSWGLFQTMGESIREIGYKGDLPALCDAETGIIWGLALLQKKLASAPGDVQEGLQHWNGGANPDYASQVLARVPNYIQA